MTIFGAKGLAKEILTVLHWNGHRGSVAFFDNVSPDAGDFLYNQYPVIRTWEALAERFAQTPAFCLGVGGALVRKRIMERLLEIKGVPFSVVSGHSHIGHYGNLIGRGVCILSDATITCDTQIGEGTLINKAAIISHDVRLGAFCEVSPGAKVLGRVQVGDCTEIGTNAVILPDVRVGSFCRVGAGAVVTRDVPDHSTVVGVPARAR